MTDVVERYLTLGLSLGRHVDGLVDSYYGPAELAYAVNAAPPVDPAELAAQADALAADVSSASELDAQRRGWLSDQIHGLGTYARVLAGESLSYADEVEQCYGVRPSWAQRRRTARRTSSSTTCCQATDRCTGATTTYRRERAVERGQMVPALRALDRGAAHPHGDAGRAAGRRAARRRGGARRAVVGVQLLPRRPPQPGRRQLRSADDRGRPRHARAHEAYPGHHTERVVKEQLLVREQGFLEESIQLVPTPQSLVGEGIAELGLEIVMDDELERELDATLTAHGLEGDLARAFAIGQRPSADPRHRPRRRADDP